MCLFVATVGLVRLTTQTAFDPVVYAEIDGENTIVDYGVLHEAASAGDQSAVEGLPFFIQIPMFMYQFELKIARKLIMSSLRSSCVCVCAVMVSMVGWVTKYGARYVDSPNRCSGALHYAASNGRLAVRNLNAFRTSRLLNFQKY